jgi:hypothetical protein
VYAVLGRAEPARYHAQRCLDICLAHEIGDFDLVFAYQALARASAIAGQQAQRGHYVELARQAGEQIVETHDHEMFFADLASVLGVPDRG